MCCFRFKREDSEIDNTGNEDSDDSAATEEYQSKTKKPINKGRWSKEEVRINLIIFTFSAKIDANLLHRNNIK